MLSETLPVSTQPDEPPNVQPCHTGKAAQVCAFDIALLEQALTGPQSLVRTGPRVDITCVSCGAAWGQPHTSDCKFKFRAA